MVRYLLKNQDEQKITTDNISRTRKLSGECTLTLQSTEEHPSPKKVVLLGHTGAEKSMDCLVCPLPGKSIKSPA